MSDTQPKTKNANAAHAQDAKRRNQARGGMPAGPAKTSPFGRGESGQQRKPGDGFRFEEKKQASDGRPALPFSALFPPLSKTLEKALDIDLRVALSKVRHLSRAHRETLPSDIVELSELLTVNRAEMRRPYWASPALTSAYLYYFLPWNLIRLCRLFSGLRLQAPRSEHPVLVDLGSGPLTLPLALWLARPEWRKLELEIVAVDCAGRPPHLGKEVLEALAQLEGVAPWKVHVVQSPLASAAHSLHPFLKDKTPWMVCAANVLNELPPEKRRFKDEEGEDENDNGPLEALLESLFPILRKATKEAPCKLLFVEPGTRLGGTTLCSMRSLALDAGFKPLAPCPHALTCPFQKEDEFADEEDPDDGRLKPSKLAGKSWCHFTFETGFVPPWLAKLSQEAGLSKETLSLSCLLLAPAPEDGRNEKEGTTAPASTGKEGKVAARVVSQPFRVPGCTGPCRYACSKEGLLLLEDAAPYAPGSSLVLPAQAIQADRTDKKSGAKVASLLAAPTRRRPEAGRREGEQKGPAPRQKEATNGAPKAPAKTAAPNRPPRKKRGEKSYFGKSAAPQKG